MNKIYFYIKAFAVVGIVLAVYLLWQQIFSPSFQPCSINEQINCDAIVKGSVSKTFGISTPLIGLTGYILIFVGAFLRMKKFIFSMTVFGLGFCLWIAFQEFFYLRVICPVCIACQITMTMVFILSVVLLKKNKF